jgi:lysozyme
LNFITDALMELVKYFEGYYSKAYKCPAGVWTIGWGTTVYPDGKKVKSGDTCTKEIADKWLRYDLHSAEEAVRKAVKIKISDAQFSALVSFAYNVGNGGMRNSTLIKELNAQFYGAAGEQFMRWNKGGGKVLKGLTRRRLAEREMFMGRDWQVCKQKNWEKYV